MVSRRGHEVNPSGDLRLEQFDPQPRFGPAARHGRAERLCSAELAEPGARLVLMTVSYTAASFRRARFVGAGGLIELRPPRGHDLDEARLALAEVAAEIVTETWARHDRGGGDDDLQSGHAIVRSKSVVIPVWGITSAAWLEEVLARFAAGLEARGISGKLSPVKQIIPGPVRSLDIPALRAWLCLPVDLDAALPTWDPLARRFDPRWWVPDEVTEAVFDVLVDWVLELDGDIRIGWPGSHVAIGKDDAREFIRRLVRLPCPIFRLESVRSDRRTRKFSVLGECWVAVTEYDDEDRDPTRDLATLTGLMTRLTQHGLVTGIVQQVTSLDPPPLPKSPIYDFWGDSAMWSHLAPTHVLTPAGIQVLTTKQLGRTRLGADPDTSRRWQVEALPSGHHLVMATDPSAWFDLEPTPYADRADPDRAAAVPTAETLAAAMADFEPAILTRGVFVDHPPPLPEPERTNLQQFLRGYRLVPRQR